MSNNLWPIDKNGKELDGAALEAWKKAHGAVGSDGRTLDGAVFQAWLKSHVKPAGPGEKVNVGTAKHY